MRAILHREVIQFGPAPIRTKAAAEEALTVLIAHGWAVQISDRPRRYRLQGAEA